MIVIWPLCVFAYWTVCRQTNSQTSKLAVTANFFNHLKIIIYLIH